MYKIALTRPVSDWGMEYLASRATLKVIDARDKETVLLNCDGMDALVGRGISEIDDDFFAQLKARGVRVVASHGTGLDGLDLDAATAHDIAVVYAPGANSRSVAEYTIAAMTAMIKQIHLCTQSAHDGDYSYRWSYRAPEFLGMKIYVIGFGNIGKKVARMCQGLDMRVAAYDKYLPKEVFDEMGVEYCANIFDGLADADVVSIHTPITPETRGIANAEMFDRMKPSAYFINTARGELMDEGEVIKRVNDGRLAGAVLDANSFDTGTPNPDLEACRKIIYSCHIAAMTDQALNAMARDCADGIFAVLDGKRWEKTANKDVFDKLGFDK